MNVFTFLLLSIAGGVGAAARLLVDGLLRARGKGAFPFETTVINVTGSLFLGLITSLAIGHLLPEEWHLILGGGLLGGYTTFSTASFETVRLIQDRRYLPALANGPGMLIASVLASGLGLWVGFLF